jgi:hypothetical protein
MFYNNTIYSPRIPGCWILNLKYGLISQEIKTNSLDNLTISIRKIPHENKARTTGLHGGLSSHVEQPAIIWNYPCGRTAGACRVGLRNILARLSRRAGGATKN